MIRFSCPSCKKTYQAPIKSAGKPTKCQACGQKMKIPSPPMAAPAPQENHENVVNAQVVSGTQIPWARWLQDCQQRFGAAPRSFDGETQEYLTMEMSWVYGFLFFVPLCKLLKSSRQKSIFRQGNVVWAHVIQANNVLWEPPDPTPEDNGDAPGELVFSLDTTGRVTPPYLESLAEKLGETRGQSFADPEIMKIGNYLDAETVRAFGWDVPKRFSPKMPCYISTTMFLRKHLPGEQLFRGFLPVVVAHKAPYFVMPLPERFWSPELLAWWMNG